VARAQKQEDNASSSATSTRLELVKVYKGVRKAPTGDRRPEQIHPPLPPTSGVGKPGIPRGS